jgi:hypothetical protein
VIENLEEILKKCTNRCWDYWEERDDTEETGNERNNISFTLKLKLINKN